MSPKIKKILSLSETHLIEIVSYGLAPNPNGFCYESDLCSYDPRLVTFQNKLDALNKKETSKLRKYIFGGA